MNQKKLNIELMRAILRSSILTYDDAYPIVAALSSTISKAVFQKEQEITATEEMYCPRCQQNVIALVKNPECPRCKNKKLEKRKINEFHFENRVKTNENL